MRLRYPTSSPLTWQVRSLARTKAPPQEITAACERCRSAFSGASASGKAGDYLASFMTFMSEVSPSVYGCMREAGRASALIPLPLPSL